MTETAKESDASPGTGPPVWTTVYGRAPVPEQRGHSPGADRAGARAPVDGTADQAIERAGPVPPTHPGREAHAGRKTLVALAVVVFMIVTGGAVGYSLLRPKVYGATAEFILTPRTDMTDAAVDRAMETQVMITESRPVLEAVGHRIGMPPGELRDATSAEVVGRSNILRVTVGDRDQARAVRLVQLITEEYLAAAAAAGPTATAGADTSPLTRATLLSAASPTARPLEPRPKRALAVGMLLGMIAGLAVVALVVRPRFLFRPSAYWT